MRRQRGVNELPTRGISSYKDSIRAGPGRFRMRYVLHQYYGSAGEPGGIGDYGGDSSAWKQSLHIAWADAGRDGGGVTGAALVDYSNRRGKVAAIWRMGNSTQGISREPGVGGGDGGRRRRYFQRSAANARRTRGARGGDPRLPQHSEGS